MCDYSQAERFRVVNGKRLISIASHIKPSKFFYPRVVSLLGIQRNTLETNEIETIPCQIVHLHTLYLRQVEYARTYTVSKGGMFTLDPNGKVDEKYTNRTAETKKRVRELNEKKK